MITKGNVWQFSALLLLGALTYQQPDGPQEQVPELEALSSYLGNWDSEFTIVSHDKDSIDEKFTGKVEANWSVGGRFLEQTGTYTLDSNSPPMVIKTLMTFDVNDQKYRYHFFDSTGEHRVSTSSWNAEKKTMTSTMREPDGEEMITTADFSAPGIETWTIVITSAKNQSTTKITGKNTRRK
jgi:hypothetical protein